MKRAALATERIQSLDIWLNDLLVPSWAGSLFKQSPPGLNKEWGKVSCLKQRSAAH
ncbi:hypothetical protein LOC51_09305 [Rubrivivax sp. JA1024]|nr:hypothetical protein [Rubrivivax sp. JA1024]